MQVSTNFLTSPKVWGIAYTRLSAEWAAQRIKDLSFKTIALRAFLKRQQIIKSLIQEFRYPRLGPGMMWNKVTEVIEERGGVVHRGADVVEIRRTGSRVTGLVISRNGRNETITGTDFISSMPLTEVIEKLDPPPPREVLEASRRLSYRDFLTVCLIVDRSSLFSDNWIYVHEPDVKVARIQNYKNWNREMVPDSTKTSLGLEYFCNEGDELWSLSNEALIELGKRELEKIGLSSYDEIEDGCVYRVPKSYPIYDSGYREHLAVPAGFLDRLENFQTIGRNGLHRYDNQDHAMLTGMAAVRNLVNGEDNDLWNINADEEYQEEIRTEKEGR